jgi:hypothetical protein
LKGDDAMKIYSESARSGMDNALNLGIALGYKKSTVYKCVQKKGCITTTWRHPPHKKKWETGQIEQAIQMVEANPTLTLSEIIQMLEQEGFSPIKPSTLYKYFDLALISYKALTIHSDLRNSPETIRSRQEYAVWFLNNQNCTFVYIDEFGYNLSTIRHYGRAHLGHPAILTTPANQGANVSVVAAVQKDVGIVKYASQQEAFNTESFAVFIQQLIAHYQADPSPNVCFIMDNCRIHHAIMIPQIIQSVGFLLKFLPPYSPMLNPIEEVIGDIKRTIKTLLSTTLMPRVMEIRSQPRGRKTALRRSLLKTALGEAMSAITIPQVDAHYAHSYSFLV